MVSLICKFPVDVSLWAHGKSDLEFFTTKKKVSSRIIKYQRYIRALSSQHPHFDHNFLMKNWNKKNISQTNNPADSVGDKSHGGQINKSWPYVGSQCLLVKILIPLIHIELAERLIHEASAFPVFFEII